MAVNEVIEKRQSRRAFFTMEDGIATNLLLQSNGGDLKPVPVTLLSISVGGMSVAVRRYRCPGIKEGDRLTFMDIAAPQPLGTIPLVEVVVKYVVSDHPVRVALGCEFEGIPERYKEKIDFFVDERLKAMGLAY